MAQAEIKYSVPYDTQDGKNGFSVDLVVTYDPASYNSQYGFYTLNGASGTYVVTGNSGQVISSNTITGLAPVGAINNTNSLYANNSANGSFIDNNGIGFTISNTAASDDGAGNVELESGGGGGASYSESGNNSGPGRTAFAASITPNPVPTPCYVTGTPIRTARGDVVVESLVVGDLAITTSGAHRPIRWLGHRTVCCRVHPSPHEAMPIRISAHAFAENRPSRDLRVSPGHAICVDAVGEVLIPAAALVNGTTIVQEQVDTITYWHVELEGGHDIILAENLPCESYIEMGNRSFFAEAETTALHASPDASVVTHDDFCRPFHQDGPVVAFVRERLAARSPSLGWALKENPLADLHLIVDGQRVEAENIDLCARFLMPANAKDVWLVSDTSVPAEIGIALDLRSLGVCVGSLVIDDGFGSPSTISADDPLLSVGFHDIEKGPQRWTAGRSRLPAELWDRCRGSFFLRVELTRPALPRWVKPADVREDLMKLTA